MAVGMVAAKVQAQVSDLRPKVITDVPFKYANCEYHNMTVWQAQTRRDAAIMLHRPSNGQLQVSDRSTIWVRSGPALLMAVNFPAQV